MNDERSCDGGAVFRTTGGEVRGRAAVDGVTAVLGIPYAAPPFGDRRFREPQPAAAWEGVRDGTEFGPIAPQSAELPGAPVWRPGDEDVLTVNIWTPAPTPVCGPGPAGAPAPMSGPAPGPSPALAEGGGAALPVLFWIHGGANTFGSSAQPDFDGTALARAGLVVVSCNYRVGFEGFGHVPGRPDNRGLLDQVAALRWVRENVAAFGGDPGNVTVAGHSSGGASAVCLMAMGAGGKSTAGAGTGAGTGTGSGTDMAGDAGTGAGTAARGLFRRVIAHSVPGVFYTVELAAAVTARVAAEAGVAPTAEGLSSVPPEALVAASDRTAAGCAKDPVTPIHACAPVIFQPVVDGAVLPASVAAARTAPDVDLLVCHALEEQWFLHRVGAVRGLTTEAELAAFVQDLELPSRLVDGYGALMPDAPVLDRFLALFGDAQFAEYTTRLAERHARDGGRAHLARFARRREGARPWHTADVPFAFGNLDVAGADFLVGGAPDADDRALSDRMLRAWAAFAATGDPGWPPVTAERTPVRSWAVPADRLSDGDPSPFRALWQDVEFAPHRPHMRHRTRQDR
ncbi:carboxylesterase/lipase family protein [Streptomyces sp. NPDC127114]|uniref:carboxylesterase/lipase family protein n=1 Tax=Streptomyces sp. NPDC127114 TaxID=3345366 RepID=UPI003645D513